MTNLCWQHLSVDKGDNVNVIKKFHVTYQVFTVALHKQVNPAWQDSAILKIKQTLFLMELKLVNIWFDIWLHPNSVLMWKPQ